MLTEVNVLLKGAFQVKNWVRASPKSDRFEKLRERIHDVMFKSDVKHKKILSFYFKMVVPMHEMYRIFHGPPRRTGQSERSIGISTIPYTRFRVKDHLSIFLLVELLSETIKQID
jgi:hypothetical protein